MYKCIMYIVIFYIVYSILYRILIMYSHIIMTARCPLAIALGFFLYFSIIIYLGGQLLFYLNVEVTTS